MIQPPKPSDDPSKILLVFTAKNVWIGENNNVEVFNLPPVEALIRIAEYQNEAYRVIWMSDTGISRDSVY